MKRSSTKALALLLMTVVLLAALTTAALAAPAEPEAVDIEDGPITIGSGTYAQGTGEAAPIPEGGLVITGTSDSNTIIVDPGAGKKAAFTIDGLTLSTESGARLIDVQSGGAEITLSGENTLTGGGAGALIRVSKGQALTIKGSGSLELSNGTTGKAAHGAAIGGSVSEDGGTINIGSGNITIVQYGPGAGIGGGGPNAETSGTGDSGDITISGGNIDITVTAVDNYGGGCGIGPGMNYKATPQPDQDGRLEHITISGGTVEVSTTSKHTGYGVYRAGAAIGTGRIGADSDEDGKIHITGTAKVTASADVSAAIGGSSVPSTSGPSGDEYIPSGNVTILIDEDSTVKADTLASQQTAGYGVYGGAAIGKAFLDWLNYEIQIADNAQVVAQGGVSGAGIGGSRGYSADSTIKITIGGNAEVYASSLQDGAGIGSGTTQQSIINSNVDIIIEDSAEVRAEGGYFAAGIGGGYGNDAGNITIRGAAEVTAVGGTGHTFSSYSIGSGSGIGAGAQGAGNDRVYGGGKVAGTITISPGTTVYAYAEGDKFAIDLDLRDDKASINVSDTVLNGRFAEGVDPPVNGDGEPSTIYLLKDGEIDSRLTLPDDYRSFAVTASDGEGVIKVQNAADTSQYAYYLENDAKQIVYPLYENQDDKGNIEMLTKDNLRWASFIDVKPMDITIYTGGAGYEGAVDAEGDKIGDESGFPEPGFIITAPEGVDVSELTLVYQNGETQYEWTLKPYSPGEHNVYRFVPTDDTPLTHILMQFTDKDGKVVVTDDFEIMEHLNQTLSMKAYGEGIDEGMVSFTDGENTYPITVGEAKVTVRSTTDNAVYAGVEIEETVEGEPRIVVPEDTVYHINGGAVQVADDSGVALLFDDIIEVGEGSAHKEMLRNRALKELGEGNWQFEYKYLDLVDTANGNAWVKANNTVTVCWPRPENAPEDAEFTLLHFEDLHREMGINAVEDMVDSCTVTNITLTPSEDGEYLCFEIEPGGFSPFVLAWKAPDEPDEPDIPPYIPPVEPEEPVYEPNWLNTTDHFGYIIGYEDGTIRPDASITRAEVATIFFRLLTDEARDKFWTETNSYSDVAETAWYNNAVSTLSRMGILGGYEDGTFRPNDSITRAEFAKIAVSFFEYEDISAENIFTDVAAGSWYENFVAVAAKLGLIEGYAGNVYRPNESITRAEACTIINRTLGRAPDADHLLPESEMNTWPDNRPGTWYYAQLQEATNSHEYKWSGDIEHWTAKLPERDWDALQ